MPHERLRPSFIFNEERFKQLQQITPEAFADGKINWEVLKESLGESLEEEGQEAEHFGLFWPGKRQARKIASILSKGALIPVKGEGVNEETTKNIFIEGENLEVLKLLQKSYAGKIKMIYIDPPYNTGNDFVYDDNFTEPLEEYLKYSGQMDEEGKVLTTNTKADGRFHSKWLSMMYPRLRLARNLLSNDGIIFISIDDNEIDNLRKLCSEIFGEENLIATFIWTTKNAARGVPPTKMVMTNHEYILCYSKTENVRLRGEDRKEEDFQNPDNDSRGLWRSESMKATGRQDNKFVIKDPKTGNEYHGNWAFSKETIKKMIGENLILFPEDPSGTPRQKKFMDSYTNETKAIVSSLGWYSTESATKRFMDLFDGKKIFDFPKPEDLMGFLVKQTMDKEGICLDFFAGSCPTAHAVIDLNKQDGINRRFIMVQLPELCDEKSEAFKAGFKNVSEVGKERIRRVINNWPKKERANVGFKVFKLDLSNFTPWQNYEGGDLAQLKDLFSQQGEPLVDGWKPENLLIEVMLQEGFPLDSDILELKEHKKNKVTQVSSNFCQHKLLVSFDKKIAQDTIVNLKIEGEDIFVCLDGALTDEQKVTLSDKGFLKTI